MGDMDFARTAELSPRLKVLPFTGSTNADLRAWIEAEPDLPHLCVVLTRDQRAGRGRLDRAWETPPGAAIAVSVLLRLGDVAASERGWIPLVAGLAMVEAIAEQLPGRSLALKWPNDVLLAAADARGEGKICGILAESVGADVVVVGAGVNTAMTAAQAPVATATSFAMQGALCDDDLLVASYLTALERSLRALRGSDAVSSGIHAAVSGRCATLGQEVRAILPAGEVRGRALRLEPDGRLVIQAPGAEQIIGAGDIVHLRSASGR